MKAFICALGFSLLISANAFSIDQISLVDGLGRTVTLEKPATRVISLSPSCTEVLFAIGAADRVVGVTAFCDYPPDAAKKPKVGGFSGKSVSTETIVALKPDVVIVEGQMHARVISMLESVHVRCYAAEAQRLEDAYRIIDHIGILLGYGREALKVSSAMRKRIETIAKLTAKTGIRPTAFWEVWDDPLMTAGGPTFISESISAAGGKNVFADAKEQYPAISIESILSRDPDWILSGTDRATTLNIQALSSKQGWRSMRAVREGRIALIDADSINRAGPRLADAIEALARVFHPGLFP